jgi:hypothetical protein
LHLVLIETYGNQAFIFATNKLRENVGASELTYRAGTRFVLQAVGDAGGPKLYSDDPQALRDTLLNPRRNPPLESSAWPVEVILATSGKALLLVRDEATARKIVQRATEYALREAPGLDVAGVVSDDFRLDQKPLHEVVKKVHELHESLRATLPGPTLRFLRLPVVVECATSGLPATGIDRRHGGADPRSAVSFHKHRAAQEGLQRLTALASHRRFRLPLNLEDLDRLGTIDWLAVVHADGNGLGEIFLKFHKYTGTSTPAQNRDYVDKLRRFSLALDVCTEEAFCAALGEMYPRWQAAQQRRQRRRGERVGTSRYLPLVPLVLGGDDLTVVCDGRLAVPFTVDFLRAFEQQTARKDVLDGITPELAGEAFKADRLSSCAGVAIVKPHFPFHTAYELAEDLLQSAKKVKKQVKRNRDGDLPCSAVDYHVLYDVSGADLADIRSRLVQDGGKTNLVARPYVTTPTELLSGYPEAGRRWAEMRHVDLLRRRLRAVHALDEDNRRLLPNSMLHDLREGLFLGRGPAEARLQLVVGRYLDQGLGELLVRRNGDWSLFDVEPGENEKFATGLLDVMDVAEFWEEE